MLVNDIPPNCQKAVLLVQAFPIPKFASGASRDPCVQRSKVQLTPSATFPFITMPQVPVEILVYRGLRYGWPCKIGNFPFLTMHQVPVEILVYRGLRYSRPRQIGTFPFLTMHHVPVEILVYRGLRYS